MAKRRGTELNHDNWDKLDDVKEEAGTFTPLSQSELKTRIIKQARRTLPKTDSETGSPCSPFTAFSGFSKKSPFGSFSFSTNQSKTLEISAATSKPGTSNGDSLVTTKTAVAEEKLPSSVAKRPALATDKPENKNMEYFRQLQSLNESVLKWMQLHIAKNPCCDFTPVFNDYRHHLQKLDTSYPKSLPKSTSADSAFKIPQPKPDDSTDSTKASPQQRFFSLEKSSLNLSSSEESEKDKISFSSSNTSTIPNFKFTGFTPTPSPSGPPGQLSSFSFATDESVKKGSPFFSGLKTGIEASGPGFSFGVPPVTSNSENTANSAEGDEEYVPPKNDFSVVSEEDALYSKRCKLFYQKDGTYVEKGVGTLYLKGLDGKTQLLVRADTNLGNVLLNIMLSSSLPMERTGKNNVLIVCVPNPPIDVKSPDSREAIPLLIRVKTGNDADELFEKLNQYKS